MCKTSPFRRNDRSVRDSISKLIWSYSICLKLRQLNRWSLVAELLGGISASTDLRYETYTWLCRRALEHVAPVRHLSGNRFSACKSASRQAHKKRRSLGPWCAELRAHDTTGIPAQHSTFMPFCILYTKVKVPTDCGSAHFMLRLGSDGALFQAVWSPRDACQKVSPAALPCLHLQYR